MNSGSENALPSKQPAKPTAPGADPLFEALRRTQLVVDFLDAFHKGTGIQLQFLPAAARFRVHNPEPSVLHLAVPVVIADKHTATIASEAIRCALGADRPAAVKAFGKTSMPVVTEIEYLGLERLVSIFAQHLSCFANRYLVAPRRKEPACVTRAREYIRQHAGEALTSDQVARKVSVSRQHFCKLFRQTTGMTFTQYLTRVRVEKAQQLLQNPARRIGEIAYACGFVSISQFNRAFRTHLGTTPSAWRKSAAAQSGSPRRESGDQPKSKEPKK